MASLSFLGLALRVGLLLGLALAAMGPLRKASSATRRLVLAFALVAALVLPVVSWLAPAWHVAAPRVARSIGALVVGEPLIVTAGGGGSHLVMAVFVVWAIGALAVLGRLGLGLLESRGIARRAERAASWSATVAWAERVFGQRAVVRVTAELEAPAVTGLFAPVVLVPKESEGWSEERKFAVLAHELAHVRQRDCAAQVVAQVVCALHWFDPLAWRVAQRLRVERELAADDAVIAAGACASRYAEDLLAIAGVPRRLVGALGMADGSPLVERVAAILALRRARSPLSRGRAALLAGGVAAASLAIACGAPTSSGDPGAARASSPVANPPSTSETRAPATTAASLRMGMMEAHGRLEPEVIQRIIRQNFGRFRRCYDAARLATPGLEGRVAVNFTIDASGNVSSAEAGESDMSDPQMVACVVRGFSNLSFPAPTGGEVLVTFPILFHPGG
ncbi:MAG TPA: M56 family metallopeptidase [Polyangiaceae bacterium]|jgi:beta-lactamase regulating signal transducer with metallopeptidase domain